MARALEILVVEDDAAMQRMIETVFKTATLGEYLVRRTGDLEGAIKAILEVAPDLILLDLDLPDAKGLEGLRSILGIAPEAAIVILTANLDQDLALQAIQLGAQDWLRKVDSLRHVLPRAVSFAVERQRIRQRLMGQVRALQERVEG